MRSPWISKEKCRLADRRAVFIWTGRASTREICKARRDFQRTFEEDRHQGVQAAGETIKGWIAAGIVKEAWDNLAMW